MKKLISGFLLLFSGVATHAQPPVTSLHQNFDVACAATIGFPYSLPGWSCYTPVGGTAPQGGWSCSATDGRSGTPGIECTNYWSSVYHLDTSFVVTPLLDLSSYAQVFFTFDSKASIIHEGHLSVVVDTDSTMHSFVVLDPLVLPVIGTPDSSNWVTHQINLTPFKSTPFYLAFRFTAPTTTGIIWYLDNINTSSTALSLPNMNATTGSITIVGASTPDKIDISFNSQPSGVYHLSLYDLLGREVYKDDVMGQGIQTYTIRDQHLASGMYILRMGNNSSLSSAKVLVQ